MTMIIMGDEAEVQSTFECSCLIAKKKWKNRHYRITTSTFHGYIMFIVVSCLLSNGCFVPQVKLCNKNNGVYISWLLFERILLILGR